MQYKTVIGKVMYTIPYSDISTILMNDIPYIYIAVAKSKLSSTT